MENNAISIKNILSSGLYIIPRYQRNYAWEKKEISQLIRDINEFFQDSLSESYYYLGSLVCFKREDGKFELVDGQQRHTTITLINLVLKNWRDIQNNWEDIPNTVPDPNIEFDSRKKVQNYIKRLYELKKDFNTLSEEFNNATITNFKVAIELIREELREIQKNSDIIKFADNFYNNVFLFRVEVPEDTDLNHYFEIMNSRGEQLEKHEIVKSLLMGKIEGDDKGKYQNTFAEIWDACSDMTDYVYFNFSAKKRKELFENGNLIATKFEDINIETIDDDNGEKTLTDIILNYQSKSSDISEKMGKEKYKSVIDFPNFLLQVLKINHDISLDDKKLLTHFKHINSDQKSREFIYDLLKYRTLFDKYIIKQDLSDTDESKQNWGIRKLEIKNIDKEKTEYSLIKTFSDNEDCEELIKLQVMLYYSDSTNTYNDWLQQILKNNYYFSSTGSMTQDLNNYTKKVLYIASKKFNKNNLSYPDISIFNLYFIDFLLWKLYYEEVRNINKIPDDAELKELKEKIFKQRESFNSFRFRQLSSKEHLAAIRNISSQIIPPDILNGIGNLCLISVSQNSAGNKESPEEKKVRFQSDRDPLSLKRIIMFESFENDKWKKDQIEKHEEEVLKLIDNYIKF